jgi:hypothetical protein
MNRCPYCGRLMVERGAMCTYHGNAADRDDWARGNRIMCDFIHRGIVAPALSVGPRCSALDALLARREAPMVA